jgi:hypothetical protein
MRFLLSAGLPLGANLRVQAPLRPTSNSCLVLQHNDHVHRKEQMLRLCFEELLNVWTLHKLFLLAMLCGSRHCVGNLGIETSMSTAS